jgi:hypothetical protein
MPDQNPSDNQDGESKSPVKPNSSNRVENDDKPQETANAPTQEQQQSDKFFRRASLIIDALVFIAVAIYSVFAALQWSAMNTQVTVMNAQLDTAKNDQRAWVTVQSCKLDKALAINEAPAVVVEVINSGRTPALDAQIYSVVFTRALSWSNDLPTDTTNVKVVSRMVISPGARPTSTLKCETAFTEQTQIDVIQEGYVNVFATGVIKYFDVFKREHRTNFCFQIGGKTLDGLFMQACEIGNTAD